MHTEIRWMSRGKCLERFFALRAEIPVFLEDTIQCDTSAYCAKLRNTDFLLDMAFLADITSHLNHLNMRLQGRCQTVSDLYAHMNAFVTKLTLFKDGFSADRPNLAHFPSCEEMRKDAPECEKTLPKYRADIETLQQQFKKRFQDFHTMQPRIELFTNPLSAAIIEQPPELQLEMCELQDFALSMASMFGSTYICESNFSMMKHIKSRERNRLTDETLFHLMQIGCTNVDIDIQSIVQQQERPQVSH
ncbi:General transcription factor II-I repeat domain containing protein 2A [Dissostichus eleginoides]|uniref:General transcription factor II-I repeat domain containing protein 2A n=1 Tax=Dissostichus eleginoides TaxID=100907 RepID=A0AAD9CAF6_DISEL|nr:General transcription factor II-I repeat domain containing protein 2A [Dissostichus eleginoides]